jgi:sulfide:quinone oxidoreductase
MKRVVILGAGFGGLTVAHELRSRLGPGHAIVVIDRDPQFVMGLRKPWAALGLESLDRGRRNRSLLNDASVQFLQHRVTKIDPQARRVETESASIEADHLVVALGAEPRPDLVPGLAEHAHDLYERESIPRLAEAVAHFEGGHIRFLIAGAPYKCPPAPYEFAMLLEEHLREHGLRDRTTITVSTVQPMLLPNAGREGSAWVGEQLTSRGIAWQAGCKIKRVEAARVCFEDGDDAFDLLIGVPPHRPPHVIEGSGLAGEGPWVDVNPATLRTRFEHVYAIGDVTQIKLANGLPLPKAGLFAELEGQKVAAAILAEVLGTPPPQPFDGRGFCFVETGKAAAALVEGDFFARPEPRVGVGDVSAEHSTAKHRFEAERLERWFGE